MSEQTPNQAAAGTATLEPGMSPVEVTPATPAANPPAQQAQAMPDPVIEALQEAGVSTRGITTREEALTKLRNLNSMVGDEAIAVQRKIAQHLTSQTNLSESELVEYLESGATTQVTPSENPRPVVSNELKLANERTTKLLVKDLVRDIPEAKSVESKLLARSLETGKDPEDIWAQEFQPILKAGMEQGAKKLQSTMEAQPTSAVSTQTETTTKLNMKEMTAAEMRKHLPIAPPK